MKLQTSLTTDVPTSSGIECCGGRLFLKANGTWGAGTLTLKWCELADGTFVPIGTGVSLMADGSQGFEVPAGFVQASLAGSTAAIVHWGFAGTGGYAGERQ